jgi:hypothetical protein
MANVSLVDFTVIREPQVLLSSNAGGDPRKDFNFEVNQDLSSKSSVLVYNVFMDENQPEPLVYKININNGREQLVKQIRPPYNGPQHEIFANGVLDPGTNNIELFIDAGTGEMFFGDMLIFYQRDLTI